ncbi:hypothetical protein MMC29_005805 [Sticta canariensis]|nr:hypothetical protein [Sticta canariensis]
MVLDEQSTSVHFEPDPTPSSSPDPYSSADSGIDFSQLPYGFFFSFPPYRNDRWKNFILKVLPQQAATIRRPLTPDESQALAYHYANGFATSTWNLPMGCLIGAYRSYATRENYRFPFYGPLKREGGWFDGERIRIRGTDLLRGGSARLLVNAFRFTSYAVIASGVTLVATTFYGMFVASAGLANDPRLKDFNADVKAFLQAKQPVRQVDHTGQGSRSTSEVSKEQRRKTIGEVWKEAKEAEQREKASGDEGSSLAGRDGTEYAGNTRIVEVGDDGGTRSGAPTRPQETGRQPVLRGSSWSNRTAAQREPTGFTDDSYDHGHDPSPSTESDWSQEASEGGSAWERIRRGAGSSATADSGTGRRGRGAAGWQRQREQREGSGSMDGDDFTFSDTEAERSYAREEAQRDFDARVEKERQGGDFSEGSDRGRRWG